MVQQEGNGSNYCRSDFSSTWNEDFSPPKTKLPINSPLTEGMKVTVRGLWDIFPIPFWYNASVTPYMRSDLV